MISYAIRSELATRVRTALGGILPPGFISAIIAAIIKAITAGGCIPPLAKAADLSAAVANDTDGYLEEAIYTELRQRHGPIVARINTVRAVKALQDYAATLKPEDDEFVGRFQAAAVADDPNA